MATVILTVYRRVDFLNAAIQSVLRQTFRDFELIVTDDADLASTRNLCESISDPRLRYRSNEITVGTPLNVAAALREARGEFVCLMNDDDLMAPAMLEKLTACLRTSPQAAMAFCDFEVIDERGGPIPGAFEMLPCGRLRAKLGPGLLQEPIEFAVKRGVMPVMGAMLRRACCDVAWFVPQVGGAYDYWLSLNLARMGPFYYLPEKLFAYRQHQDSATARQRTTRYAPEIFICRRLREQQLPGALRGFVTGELAKWLYWSGGEGLLCCPMAPEARQNLWQAWKLSGDFRAAAKLLLSYAPAPLRKLAIRTCGS